MNNVWGALPRRQPRYRGRLTWWRTLGLVVLAVLSWVGVFWVGSWLSS